MSENDMWIWLGEWLPEISRLVGGVAIIAALFIGREAVRERWSGDVWLAVVLLLCSAALALAGVLFLLSAREVH